MPRDACPAKRVDTVAWSRGYETRFEHWSNGGSRFVIGSESRVNTGNAPDCVTALCPRLPSDRIYQTCGCGAFEVRRPESDG